VCHGGLQEGVELAAELVIHPALAYQHTKVMDESTQYPHYAPLVRLEEESGAQISRLSRGSSPVFEGGFFERMSYGFEARMVT
jgi:hypothetical protein